MGLRPARETYQEVARRHTQAAVSCDTVRKPLTPEFPNV
jgi:hypothetical protein